MPPSYSHRLHASSPFMPNVAKLSWLSDKYMHTNSHISSHPMHYGIRIVGNARKKKLQVNAYLRRIKSIIHSIVGFRYSKWIFSTLPAHIIVNSLRWFFYFCPLFAHLMQKKKSFRFQRGVCACMSAKCEEPNGWWMPNAVRAIHGAAYGG